MRRPRLSVVVCLALSLTGAPRLALDVSQETVSRDTEIGALSATHRHASHNCYRVAGQLECLEAEGRGHHGSAVGNPEQMP